MFTYIDYEIIKALGVLFFSILLLFASFTIRLEEQKRRYKKILLAIVLLFVAIPFFEAYFKQIDAETNLKSFKNANSFICETIDHNQYRVSKRNGWSIENNYFIKNSLLIRADKCRKP